MTIFELTERFNMLLINSFKTDKYIADIDFNPKYKNILLSIPNYDYLELCKISEQDNYEVISILKGPNSQGSKYNKAKKLFSIFYFILFFILYI